MQKDSKKPEPTPQQLLAITTTPGPLMILAGAGTGKTFTILRRVIHQVRQGRMHPNQVVILTYTEKAARDLHRKLKELDFPEGEELAVSTFHSFCIRLMKEFNPDILANKTLIEKGDHLFLLARKIDTMDFLQSPVFRSDPLKAIQQSFIPFFSRARDELFTPDDLRERLKALTEHELSDLNLFPGISPRLEPEERQLQLHDLVDAYTQYQEWKAEQGWMDYGDMILHCWQLIENDTDIITEIRNRYRHFIIDEYQDNNYALNKIIRRILGTRPSLTVVGDQDQCIYSFRGANYYTVQDFENTYLKNNPDRKVTLEENFRSTTEILNLANTVISQDPNRVDKKLVAHQQRSGPRPVWHVAENPATPAVVFTLIRKLIADGRRYGEIAVLCRTTAKVKEISQTLERRGIPVDSFVDYFFGVPVIRDIMAWSEVITDGQYFGPALGRLLDQIPDDTGDTEIPISRYINTLDRLSHVITKKSPVPYQTLWKTIDDLRQDLRKGYSPPEMLWEIMDKADLLSGARRMYRYSDRMNLVNIGNLLTVADQFTQRDPERNFYDWVRYMNIWSLNAKEPAVQPVSDRVRLAVQVMTIHRSKGLEFPVVILPYLRSASLPTNFRPAPFVDCLPEPWYHWPRQAGSNPKTEHEAEERRIFYVGLTRAETELHLIGPESRGCKFLKSAVKMQPNLVEIREVIMEQIENDTDNDQSMGREKLFIELNRQIAEKNYAYARFALEAMQALEDGADLSTDNPYSDWIRSVARIEKGPVDSILKLSASAVDTYLDCPLKYRLSRIDGIPQKRSRAQLEFGTIVHQVLNDFLEEGEIWDKDRLLSLLDKHWKTEAFEYQIRSEELYAQARTMLLNYLEYIRINPPAVLRREADFVFRLAKNNIVIKGKIDRIDDKEDSVLVVDYKTGKPDRHGKPGKNLQLALYVEAISQGAVENVPAVTGRAQLIYLRDLDSIPEPHEFSQDEMTANLAKVETAAEGIRAGDFQPRADDRKCQYCDYRHFLCPEWENA